MTAANRKRAKPKRKRTPRQPTVAVTVRLTREELVAWLAWRIRYKIFHTAGDRADLLKLLREDIKAAAWREFSGTDPGEFAFRAATDDIDRLCPSLRGRAIASR